MATYLQSETIKIDLNALNDNERKVLDALRGSKAEMEVAVLAKQCFPGTRSKGGTYKGLKRDARGYRCVLNSLRRLVAGGFVRKVNSGWYQAT